MVRDLIAPTVHLNGTSKDELIRQHVDVLQALRAAEKALAQACPNGRDYYVQPAGALAKALAAHEARIARVQSLIDEIEEIAVAVSEQ